MPALKPGPKPPGGPVQTGTIYRLEEFMQRVGWSRHAMRAARRAGLRVIRRHGRAFVSGDDFVSYMASATDAEN